MDKIKMVMLKQYKLVFDSIPTLSSVIKLHCWHKETSFDNTIGVKQKITLVIFCETILSKTRHFPFDNMGPLTNILQIVILQMLINMPTKGVAFFNLGNGFKMHFPRGYI